MTSEVTEELSDVKKQVENMFKTIQGLKRDEKTEAFGYLRKCLDTKSEDFVIETRNQKRTLRSANGIRKIKFKNHTENMKRAVLKCRTCGSLSKTKSLLLKHLETHMGTPISCRQCKKSFNNRASYLCHISLKMCKNAKIKVTKKYNCNQCQKIFRFKCHFERHIEGHKRNNCTYCDAKLTRRKQLVHHLLSEHSIKLEGAVLFKCEHCEKRYVKKRSLYYHLKQHADGKVVCMECGWMSETQEDHVKHFSQHDKDRPWKCEKCNDRFSRRQQYLIHMKRHDRYKCITCSESFASKAQVLRHKQRGHTITGLKQMKCPHCPLAFQRRPSLQIHMRKHSDDKPMHCKYCDKLFRSPYLYFKHCASTVHEINSPEKQQLVCEICGKLFMKKYQLEQHLHRVHDHSKQPYSCDYCGHKTTNRKNMERHLSLHLEDKKECICEQCGKAFYNLTTLKDHVSYVHSQERHFKCNQCDKAFKRNSELVRHKTAHSELRPHVCSTCGVSYKRSTHLRRHEESQHGTVKKNRRVQRLTKDEYGELIPIPEEKKSKPKSSKKKSKAAEEDESTNKQVFSIMDAQSGEMVTFAIPQVPQTCTSSVATVLSINNQTFTQNVMQAVELPYAEEIWTDKMKVTKNDNLNSAESSEIFQTLNVMNSSYSNQMLKENSFGNVHEDSFIPVNMLQETISLENTTCDILLPENRITEQNTTSQITTSYLQNPYQFL